MGVDPDPPRWDPRVREAWIVLGIFALTAAGLALALEALGGLSGTDPIPFLTELVVAAGWQPYAMAIGAALAMFGAWLIAHFYRRRQR